MRPIPYIFLLGVIISSLTTFSQDNIQFIENKGQWDPQVKFMGVAGNGAFFVHEDGFTILQHHAEDWNQFKELQHGHREAKTTDRQKDLTLRSHAYRMRFLNGKKGTMVADKPLFTYNNYFIGDDPSKWAANCKVYQGITIKDVYPNVDVRYYSDRGTVKYDLIVHPGGNVNDIALKYDGAEKMELRNKELVLRTSVGEVRELQPYSYQFKTAGKSEVDVRYAVTGNVVRFNAKQWDRTTALVIDPTIIFSSFSGSTADNWGFTATYGPDGSMYGGGIVFGNGFPVSPGAFQNTFAGGLTCINSKGIDISIIKLSPNGSSRMYATYIGGSGDETPHSLIVDPQGNLIVAGRSNSNNYPVTAPLIGTGGSWDIVITKLNASGTALIGSRKIGGSGDDGANITPCGGNAISLQRNYGDEFRSEVNLDASGNIYLASCTQSNNFPVVNGFQTTNGGGQHNQDGVVLKFNSNLSTLQFSSYFGGSGNDAAYVLSVNPLNNDIYIAGGTLSDNLPGSTAGTIGTARAGIIDGFVSIISNDGSSVLKTTYLGTSAIDQVYGIHFDSNGFPYVMGQTQGTWPVVNAQWSQPNGRQFISKLQPDLSAYVYSTTFGKGDLLPDISPVAFLVDRCENVYISGWGGNVSQGYQSAGVLGLPVTPDAWKPSPDPTGNDFYFFVLKRNATQQLFGSFFGQNGGQAGDHVDGGTSRFSPDGVIYQAICANCYGGANFPTTPGAWSTNNPSGACNLAMVKIEFNLDGVRGGLQSYIGGVRDTAGCLPLRVEFRDSVQIAKSYEWNFGDGSPQVTSTTPIVTHTFNTTGLFTVMMVAIDPDKCVQRDTSYLKIRVSDLKALLDFSINKLNPCEEFRYRFDNLSTGNANFSSQSFTWDFGDGSPRIVAGTNSVFHQFPAAGTYTVKMLFNDPVFCNKVDSVVKQVRVSAFVKADFVTPAPGCVPLQVQFSNISQGGTTFQWSFGDGGTSNAVSPSHTYLSAGNYTVKLIAIDSATCNIIDSTVAAVVAYGAPVADFNATPQPPAINMPISFSNLSSADAVRFFWEFGDGDTLSTTLRTAIQHEYNATRTYTACLTAYNQNGCMHKICKPVENRVESAVDVPNAFTPASGDINSKVFVRGFGIDKMKFTIWSRWGEKVFETDDRRVGWDGRYKGQILPMDVYSYTLDVQFGDGSIVRKTGDITLIR